jgi:uncharacterized protein
LNSSHTADDWIQKLQLAAHPEGGYYRETFRHPFLLQRAHLPDNYAGDRCMMTMIYFLLKGHQFSALHRLQSVESWHFYQGCPMTLYLLDRTGAMREVVMGPDVEAGQVLQAIIPSDTWFGAQPVDPQSYTLFGCTVSPGFDFQDFELAKRDELIKAFPQHRGLIESLTR